VALQDDIYKTAESVQAGPGQTVGHAVQAYQLAQETQAARADLEQKKQANEVAKAHAFLGQLDSLSRMTPAMQNVALKNLGGMWRNMYPDMNTDFTEALNKDKDFRAQTLQVASGAFKSLRDGAPLGPDQATAINAIPGLSSSQLYDYVNKAQEDYTKKQAAALAAGKYQEERTNSDFEKLAQKVADPSSRFAIGRYQQNLDKVETLHKLTNSIGLSPGDNPSPNETLQQKIARFNKANPQDLYEVAKAADQLISNAQSTVYGTDHLMPKSMEISGSTLSQWVHGGPKPANAGEHIAKFLNIAEREGSYYRGAKRKAIDQLAAGFSHLKPRDPARFQAILGDAFTPQAAPPAGAPGAPPAGGDTPPPPSPKDGDTYLYKGVSYVVRNGHWVKGK
jgi:hypothetical protein